MKGSTGGRMKIPLLMATLSCGLVVGYLCIGNPSEVSAGGENMYVGAEKCKNCHSSPKKGDPYGTWVKEKHSHAYPTLASDEAKKLGKDKGVAEPQKSADCLKCHVTAFDVAAELKGKKFDPTLGVQCESCHGPGGKHVEARLAAEEADDTKVLDIPKDEIIGHPTAETCRKCHNKDGPNYKPFAFRKYFKEIAHLDPRKKRPADYVDKIPDDPKDDPEAEKVEFKK